MEQNSDKPTPVGYAALIALLMMLGGCVPWPHYETYTPPIYGVVTLNGQPVVGAEVSIIFCDMACNTNYEKKSATTDAEGRFKIDRIGEFHFFAFFEIGDRFYNTRLAIDSAGKQYQGYYIPGGIGETPTRFDCELASPIPGYGGDRFCKMSFPDIKKD